MQAEIAEGIQKALNGLGVADAAFVVERPGDFSHGDYATNAALIAAKQLGKNPKEVAEMLLAQLQEVSPKSVSKIEIAGPGFINFFLTHEAVVKEIEKASKNEFPKTLSDVSGKEVMVEYTDPNPFKEFHIGHLMSNTIGESIARMVEYAGAHVVRANYQGDVGPHVAKALYVLLAAHNDDPTLQDISAAYVEGAKLYDESPEKKAEIDELNKTIYEKSDERVVKLYDQGRKLSLEHFEELYAVLGTTFTHYFFESDTHVFGSKLVQAHLSDGVFQQSEGAVVYTGEKVGLHTRVFLNSKGLPTYEAKDLGLLQRKAELGLFDLSITITASEQNDYFKVVLAAAKEIPELREIASKTMHIPHGMMRFAEGKMSSRKGNVITGESLLRDLQVAAKEKMQGCEVKNPEKTAEQIAVGAIKYAVLKQGRGRDIIFDPEKSLSIEGDSGPYLQYAHTRALSLLRAAGKAGILSGLDAGKLDVAASPRSPAAETSNFPASHNPKNILERTLLHFPEVVARASVELEPHHVTTYLTELASAFNSWYANEKVIGGDNPQYGVLITEAFANTMCKGLYLLGIPVPEEM